jgi:ferric-dicitrate binding protein FerR (iron transport regulator)
MKPMDKSNDHIENLIICYLNGKCSEVQKQELLDWVNASEENKLLFIRTKDIWDSARQQPDCSNEQLIDFYRRLVVRKEKTPVRHLLRVASMAAMLAVAFVAGILVYSYLLFPEARQIVYSVR